MGEQEGWTAQQAPSGHLLNGLLSNGATSMIRVLDSEQWAKAEERAAQLIACIQPDAPSESRRNAVADYVQRLISKCFPCQVFTFGSVPLKTYLPDGDIDLTAFSKDQNLKDTWAHQVRDMLENEEKHENAEFQVKEVQYIQAEVKLVKCLVENIVVDISFNQLGGLCTLCFLEEVDLLISQNHLFKRSIILIKAWCYYESRVLGAHHGLISTYALETLVLYIFHVYNNSFSGPLEVLYRFLEFFSKFDWENFCVSLWGPVPIRSLPDITAEPPRRDGGELLLSKYFLDTCSSRYAVCQENQRQPFVSKHFNVVDPLRLNNNLGRSVSKGNFFRIRSAFSFGAKQLARLLDCPKEDLYYEVNQFFTNTWERHGCGQRPDAPRIYARPLEFPKLDNSYGSKNARNISSSKGSHISSGDETEAEGVQVSCGVSSRYVSHLSEIRISDVSTVFHTQSQKSYGSMNNSKTSDQVRKGYNSNQNVHNDTAQRVFQADNLLTDVQGRYLFARTRSSPELTETYEEATSRGRQNRMPESGKTQSASMRSDNNGRKNMESVMMASSRQSIGTAADSNSLLISNQDDNDRDWNPPSTVGTERAERTVGPQLESSFPVSKHQLPGFEETQTSGSDPQIPIAPFLLGPGSGHRTMDNSAVPPFAFTITGPPVPFLFFPVYNIPSETGTPDSSTSHFNWDEGLDHNDSGKIFELSEGIDQSEVSSTSSSMRKVSSLEPSEHKSDILNGDIASHWQNLQYGRFCQNSRYPPNLIYPSPFVVPPVYLQGHFPWDGPGRTPSSNMNIFSQIVNNGPRILPSNPLQSVSNRPTSAFQRYVDEMPRYRSGTGTYLPNPKASMRERHSANMRRGKYNYDRNGYQGDKEGNWNANSKSRTAGHSHGRNQNEKSRFTFDQFPAVSGESRAERPWGSHRHDSFTSYESRNGPVRSNSQSSSASMPHGMYPVAAMNPNGSVVMLYPYDHNSSYGSPAEQLEFGSFGPVGFSGMNEVSQVSDGSSSSGVYDEHRFYGTSAQRSSPDQPSSPTSKGGL